MATTLINTTLIVAYSIVSLLHLAGLLLLWKAKKSLLNQRILTMNIAAIEMFYCLEMVVLFSTFPYLKTNVALDYILHFFTVLLYIEIRLTMLHIILDRFLEIFINIKYPIYMTHKQLLIIMASLWSISVACASISVILQAKQFHLKMALILDIVILLCSVTTYGYFFTTVFKMKRLDSSLSGESRTNRVNLLIRKFKLPCYIVLTYICFNLASTTFITYDHYIPKGERDPIIKVLANTAMILGFISDSLIYIFANKNVRTLICTLCRKRN